MKRTLTILMVIAAGIFLICCADKKEEQYIPDYVKTDENFDEEWYRLLEEAQKDSEDDKISEKEFAEKIDSYFEEQNKEKDQSLELAQNQQDDYEMIFYESINEIEQDKKTDNKIVQSVKIEKVDSGKTMNRVKINSDKIVLYSVPEYDGYSGSLSTLTHLSSYELYLDEEMITNNWSTDNSKEMDSSSLYLTFDLSQVDWTRAKSAVLRIYVADCEQFMVYDEDSEPEKCNISSALFYAVLTHNMDNEYVKWGNCIKVMNYRKGYYNTYRFFPRNCYYPELDFYKPIWKLKYQGNNWFNLNGSFFNYLKNDFNGKKYVTMIVNIEKVSNLDIEKGFTAYVEDGENHYGTGNRPELIIYYR